MHRYDKYSGVTGGFRAPLAAAWPNSVSNPTARVVGVALGVGLNGSGQVVPGAGSTGIIGVLVVDKPKAAGDIVDVMTAGEIADFIDYEGGESDPTAPGEVVSAAGTGGVLAAGTDLDGRTVGVVVQTNGFNRLIVRMGGVTEAAG